jgi:hypothetical protein
VEEKKEKRKEENVPGLETPCLEPPASAAAAAVLVVEMALAVAGDGV